MPPTGSSSGSNKTPLLATHNDVPLPPSIYFGGCAFGAAFYIGVHKAMVERWGEDFWKHTVFGGGSAGTVFAIGMALGKDPTYLDNLYRRIAEKSLEFGPVYYGSIFTIKYVREMIEEDPTAYKKLEGRCCFGTTEFFSKHRWHLSWENNDDLMECIKASFHIPFYCHYIRPLRGVEVVDGAYGFAGEDLLHGDQTLYVGIDPHAEITRTFTNQEMFFPPAGKAYDDMVDSGYEAMMAWKGDMISKVGNRRPNYEALYVLWFLKCIEIGVRRSVSVFRSLLAVLRMPFVGGMVPTTA
jgi:hypothetical protein